MRKAVRNCAIMGALLFSFGMTACKPEPNPADPAQPEAEQSIGSQPEAHTELSDEMSLDELRAYIDLQEQLMEAALDKAKASNGSGAPAMWILSDEDSTIHLFGTVHLLRPNVSWMTPQISSALEAADTVVLEADVESEQAARDMMQFVSTQAMLTGGTRLNDLLSDAEEVVVGEAFADANMSLELVQTLKPWFASITLQQMKMMSDGFDPEAGVEMILQDHVPNTPFEYLETVDQQLGRLATLPMDDQIDFLVLSAGGSADSGELLDDLIGEWSEGDVVGLGYLVGDSDAFGSDAVYDALLKSRNEDWIPKIEAMLEKPGNTFVAVGAAHLVGEDSVVKMLRDRGHDVTGP